HSPTIPVLIFTANDSFSQRITAARSGGQAYLSKSLPREQIWDRVEHTLQSAGLIEAQVMIVDDDPTILEAVAAILRPWGFAITALSDPTQFWETLTANPPDLLVLDVEMPQISGVDLCKVVRNDPGWEQLPIIFLTAHTEPEVVNRVYAVGADDFVSKPIIGPELVVRILNRLERSRLQRQISEIDPVTQILQRSTSTETMDALLATVEQHQQSLCLVLLEVERIPQINACFGFETGNQVLRYVTQSILSRLSKDDVVIRSGGTQFMVGLQNLSHLESREWLQGLVSTLDCEPFYAPDGTLVQMSCGAGMAHYPEHGTQMQALYRVAEIAIATGSEYSAPSQTALEENSINE
ncbi:MAG: response regulator, partial [Thermosynechococcaceae cyanobacterium]